MMQLYLKKDRRKEVFYLTTHLTHIYGYMALDK